LQCLVLRTLLCKLSFGLSTLVLDFLRLLGALVLKILLASVLLPREPESDASESHRDYEQLQPIPKRFPRFDLFVVRLGQD
jgi:hypothetical protein